QETDLRRLRTLLHKRRAKPRLQGGGIKLSPWKRRRGRRGTGESIPTYLKRIPSGRLQAAGEGEASSLQRAFAVAPTEVPRPSDDATLGEASRAAEDTISLDQVFGDEGSRAPPPAALPAAPNPPASARPAPAPTETVGFSFDQFFGAPGARPEDAATRP